MARFRGQRESKAPMMRPGNIRRTPNPPVVEPESNTPDSEEAIENELLNGTNDGTSGNHCDSHDNNSEVDSQSDDPRSQHDVTVVPKPTDGVNVSVSADVKVESKVKVSDNARNGNPSQPVTKDASTDTAPVITKDNTTVPPPGGAEAMETDTRGEDVSDSDGGPVNRMSKDANDSKDSGNGFDDGDDLDNLFACISMVEEQTRSNFPKTARPPGLVDCSMVSFYSINITVIERTEINFIHRFKNVFCVE